MLADVTLQALYWNKGVASYFFREQAYRELERIVKRVGYGPDEFDELESRVEQTYANLDDFEEDCYNLQTDEILEILGY